MQFDEKGQIFCFIFQFVPLKTEIDKFGLVPIPASRVQGCSVGKDNIQFKGLTKNLYPISPSSSNFLYSSSYL